jgi:hypothetical protein
MCAAEIFQEGAGKKVFQGGKARKYSHKLGRLRLLFGAEQSIQNRTHFKVNNYFRY